jgi:hypothetical protein
LQRTLRAGLAEAAGVPMLRVLGETTLMISAGLFTFALAWAILRLTGRRAR